MYILQNTITLLTMLVRYPTLLMPVPPRMLYLEMLAMRRYGCVILIVYLFYGSNVLFSWQITVPWMWVAQQPASIYGDLSICLDAPRNREFSANMSLSQFAVIDFTWHCWGNFAHWCPVDFACLFSGDYSP